MRNQTHGSSECMWSTSVACQTYTAQGGGQRAVLTELTLRLAAAVGGGGGVGGGRGANRGAAWWLIGWHENICDLGLVCV